MSTHIPFVSPQFNVTAYNCPNCGAFADQRFFVVRILKDNGLSILSDLYVSECGHCKKFMVWKDGLAVYPDSSLAPLPSPDLPEDIATDYLEARRIINASPRGAAALLRLCVQKLCRHLGEPGKDINKDIASLVKKGLNPNIQKSLDIVRLIGNGAVHPGEIDLRDKPETAVSLCQLINIIVDVMITQPKMIENLYSALPPAKLDAITKRDEKQP